VRRRAPKVGVVGAGAWGMNLVRNAAEMGILAAVCDSDLRPLEIIRTRYPDVALYCDVRSIVRSQLDGLIIAAPAVLHAEVALAAIHNGKHVFIEKPLALNERDAHRIVDAAREQGVEVMVGHLLLYHPGVRKLLELVAQDAIGTLRHMRSRRWSHGRLRACENVWWSFAPHDVAVMLALFDAFPERAVQSQHGYVQPGICDFVYTDYTFADGRSAHLEAGWLDTDKQGRIDVFGDRGVLSFTDSRKGASLTLTASEEHLGVSGQFELARGASVPVPFDVREPLRNELDSFCRAMRFGESTLSDGARGLDVVRALAMAEKPSIDPFRLEVFA
jgi:UDP-2-acetamido-3-amino-2,3-dideoxy-glucuronate N-acetyltransferase